MKERIKDKINEIENFLNNLREFAPETIEEYKKSILKKSACERVAEKIIEALVDLAFLTTRYIKEDIPADATDTKIFDVLKERGIIPESLSKKMQDAKGMRNWLAHEYGKIDDEIVFNAIKDELEKDTSEFISIVKNLMEEIK